MNALQLLKMIPGICSDADTTSAFMSIGGGFVIRGVERSGLVAGDSRGEGGSVGLGGGVVEEILFRQVIGVKGVLECYLESVHDETAKAARPCCSILYILI